MCDVLLHCYDVTNTDNENLNSVVQVVNNVTRELSFGGIFHGAVEVYSAEWSYGFCQHGTGVYRVKPRCNNMYTYRESIPLGPTHFSKQEVDAILRRLQEQWQGAQYDLLARNCCHFCEHLCEELGVKGIPGWLNRFAYGAEYTVTTTSMAMEWVRLSMAQISQSFTSSSTYIRDSCAQFFPPPSSGTSGRENAYARLGTARSSNGRVSSNFGIPDNATTEVDVAASKS